MIFAVYKPKGPSSNAVLNTIRRHLRTKRVGHAGTLDPLAEGVLVVGVGREATRKLAAVVKKEKEYIAEIRLGMTSTTDDEEGEKTQMANGKSPSLEEITGIIKTFVGVIEQMPPRYSALKVGGRRAYMLARANTDFELQPRAVEIKEIELLSYAWPILKIRVVTGPGVYIRALSRDIGEALHTGGYLTRLVRTRVGDFRMDDAVPVEKILELLTTSQ